MKISCIAIDDEPGALSLLEEYISKIDLLDLKGLFTNGMDALVFLQGQRVDVIFTEIGMPLMTGLQLAAILPRDQKFIFITGDREYALNSFAYRVIDYMLKPVSRNRFLAGVAKLSGDIEEQQANGQPAVSELFAKSSGEMVRINFNDILYVRGEKEYVSLNFKNERLLIYKRMKEMESLLPSNFIRVHISYIINADHLVKIGTGYLIAGSEKIPIGSSYRVQFQKFIDRQTF